MHISNNTSFIKNILFLSLLIEIAICAPANPVDSIAISSSNAGNNLLLNPVPSASLNVSGASNGNCASAPKFSTWQAPGWNTEDCYSAVQQMYLKEVYTHPDADYEFVAQGASSTRPDLPVEKTPRKYTVSRFNSHSPRQQRVLLVTRKLIFPRNMYSDCNDASRNAGHLSAWRNVRSQLPQHGREHLPENIHGSEEHRVSVHADAYAGVVARR